MTLKVQSTRSSTPATGTVRVKLGFVQPANAESLMEFHEIYGELLKRVQPSLVSAPPVRELISSSLSSIDPHHHSRLKVLALSVLTRVERT